MTDIKTIAAECATRIMDRMEMCRGSAILKGDIEREVEIALAQVTAAAEPEEVRWFRLNVGGPDADLEKLMPVKPEPKSLIEKAMEAINKAPCDENWTVTADKSAYERWLIDTYRFDRGSADERFRDACRKAADQCNEIALRMKANEGAGG